MTPDLVTSLIYVSRKTLPGPEGAADVQNILQLSRERNKTLQVTGALFSAAKTFAQCIEGPASAIGQLMESIARDARHHDVKVVSVKDEVPRNFANWTMAYCGDEYYIDAHIRRLFDTHPPGLFAERVEQLRALMREFGMKIAQGSSSAAP